MSSRHRSSLLLLVASACLLAFPARADQPSDSQAEQQQAETKPAPTAEPPFVKPPHAVAVNAKTHAEGNLVLAEMDEATRRKLLEKGMVLDGERKGDADVTGWVKAWVIAEQPREKVFELLIQPSAQAGFLPRLVSSETVKRTSHTELTRFHIRVAMVNVHTQVQHQWWPEVSRLAWALDPNFENGVKHQEGFWNVYALDEKTSLLEYGTVLQTSALVPRFVQEHLTRSDLPSALEAMKKYLDSGGTWRR